MIYEIILAAVLGILFGGVGGYYLGRYQTQLVDKIRTLESRRPADYRDPVLPVVAGGAYQPPKEVSTSVEKKQGAGLVETKTPQRLSWENDNELAKLEHSG